MLDREALVLENVGLVRKIARQFSHGLKDNAMDYDDLYGEGLLALVKASQMFDEHRGEAKFSTYACTYIKGYIMRYISRRGFSVSHDIAGVAIRIQKAGLHDAEPKEIAKRVKSTVGQVKQALKFLETRYVSTDVTLKTNGNKKEDDATIADLMPYEEDFSTIYLEDYLGVLTKKQRAIVEVLLSDKCKDYGEIGERFGITHQGVGNSIARARAKMREVIAANG